MQAICDGYNKKYDTLRFECELKNMYGIRLCGGYFIDGDGERHGKLSPIYSNKKVNGEYKIKSYSLVVY